MLYCQSRVWRGLYCPSVKQISCYKHVTGNNTKLNFYSTLVVQIHNWICHIARGCSAKKWRVRAYNNLVWTMTCYFDYYKKSSFGIIQLYMKHDAKVAKCIWRRTSSMFIRCNLNLIQIPFQWIIYQPSSKAMAPIREVLCQPLKTDSNKQGPT